MISVLNFKEIYIIDLNDQYDKLKRTFFILMHTSSNNPSNLSQISENLNI